MTWISLQIAYFSTAISQARLVRQMRFLTQSFTPLASTYSLLWCACWFSTLGRHIVIKMLKRRLKLVHYVFLELCLKIKMWMEVPSSQEQMTRFQKTQLWLMKTLRMLISKTLWLMRLPRSSSSRRQLEDLTRNSCIQRIQLDQI